MARQLEPGQGVDPNLVAALGGAPRSRANIRENDARASRQERKRRDKFFVPPAAIPKGWVVEWKRKTCLGRPEEPDYQMDLAEAGWKYASPKQFPMLVPEGYEGNTIERGGQVLMIRPAHQKKEALKLDREEALGQVRDKLTEIGMTGSGEAPRVVTSFHRDFDRPAGRMVPDDDGDTDAGYEGGDMRPGEMQ